MHKRKGKILAVDDNAGIRSALKILLSAHFAEVELIPSPKELVSRIGDFKPDAILLDMNFTSDINTGNEGLFWLSEIKRLFPDIEVVLFTAYADVQLAVEGMKRGAFDFIVKPWDNDRLINVLASACSRRERPAAAAPQSSSQEEILWGSGAEMLRIRKTVSKIAPTDASVLITGENGTGKDVIAKEICRLSDRASKPFVAVDLGAVTETLFESELFGHKKGAFTDAYTDREGKFEQASSGTLFLDEVGNIPVHLQAKLLRVLQNRAVTRVGDNALIPIDIRLVCATNRDLSSMVRDGLFREDLYYRINTVHIHIPPLRERKDEILPLARMFLKKYSGRYHRAVTDISPSAADVLLGHQWPGNVRELQNCIETAVIMSDGPVLQPGDISFAEVPTVPDNDLPNGEDTLEMAEEKAIRAALKRFNGNLSMVAKSLEISRPTLYSKLKKYNI